MNALNRISILAAMCVAILFSTSTTSAQNIRVIPNLGVPPNEILTHEHLIIDPGTWPADAARVMAVYTNAEGNMYDVTGVVDWICDGCGSNGVDLNGWIQLNGSTTISLRATYANIESSPFFISTDAEAVGSALYRSAGSPSFVAGSSIHAGVNHFLNQLSAARVPMGSLGATTLYTSFIDDNSFRNLLGQHYSWLGTDLGQFREPGLSRSDSASFAYFKYPSVILPNDTATAAANFSLFNAAGSITESGKTIINELFHSVVFQNNLMTDEEAGDENGAEEFFSSQIPEILEKVVEAHLILALDNPSELDLAKLRMILTNIRVKMQHLFNAYPDLFDRIMEALGFQDYLDHGGGGKGNGGNWLPDFLDDYMFEKGINYDTLPLLIGLPGGSCGSGILFNNPAKNTPSATSQYDFVTDACGDILFVQRHESGHHYLIPPVN